MPVALTVPAERILGTHTRLAYHPFVSKDDISSRQSHDRVLRAHGHGHGNVFRLFLRDGVGFLQPETERGRGAVWNRETFCGTRARLLGLRPTSSRADCQVRLYASACTAVQRGGAHTHHLRKLLG